MSPAQRQTRKVRHLDGQDGRVGDELRHLRATVLTLREELDRIRITEEARVQQAVNAGHEEVRALRQTIQALREELDVTVQRAREERDRLDADWRSQLVEAQQTIAALRAELERPR